MGEKQPLYKIVVSSIIPSSRSIPESMAHTIYPELMVIKQCTQGEELVRRETVFIQCVSDSIFKQCVSDSIFKKGA